MSNGLHLGEFHECIKHIAQPVIASTRVDADESRHGQGRMEESEDAQAGQVPDEGPGRPASIRLEREGRGQDQTQLAVVDQGEFRKAPGQILRLSANPGNAVAAQLHQFLARSLRARTSG